MYSLSLSLLSWTSTFFDQCVQLIPDLLAFSNTSEPCCTKCYPFLYSFLSSLIFDHLELKHVPLGSSPFLMSTFFLYCHLPLFPCYLSSLFISSFLLLPLSFSSASFSVSSLFFILLSFSLFCCISLSLVFVLSFGDGGFFKRNKQKPHPTILQWLSKGESSTMGTSYFLYSLPYEQ